ncbi:hypothetical protein HPP92_014627 [Vanilla planifolia]|uniref:pyridoxal 5'-phosphate synthase n=1 Tax=Vanilla planifolia TaxID=51239 RepID=A0A835UX27_VANPL|nr:hypothetical protein HPP92_014627 [Vanilla planifolia]
MTGGGASSVVVPHLRATVASNGRPSNRTVVFRGFQEGCDKVLINTDSRSAKIEELKHCPYGEICWYFTESWEQFRIKGKIDIIDSSTKDHAKMQQRVKSWFASSLKSRFQYLGPVPRFPVINEKLSNDSELDPSAGPVDTFCLLVFDPEEVDYLNLKRNERLLFALRLEWSYSNRSYNRHVSGLQKGVDSPEALNPVSGDGVQQEERYRWRKLSVPAVPSIVLSSSSTRQGTTHGPPTAPSRSDFIAASSSLFLPSFYGIGSQVRDGRRMGFLFPVGCDPCSRSYSTSSKSSDEIEFMNDVADVLSETSADTDTVTIVSNASVAPASFPGEVAAAAADSFPLVAALQHLIDAVHSFTGLNWWASIALTTVLIRGATIPLLINQLKASAKLSIMRPEMEKLKEEINNDMDPDTLH